MSYLASMPLRHVLHGLLSVIFRQYYWTAAGVADGKSDASPAP